jgi:hypothetical protein
MQRRRIPPKVRRVLDISAYPKKEVLTDDMTVTIRPLQVGDQFELNEFFIGLPAAERVRLHHAVTDPKIVAQWTHEMDLIHALPLVALSGRRIVADAVLLRDPPGNPIGEIRLTIAERFRETALPALLLRDLTAIAERLGLDAVMLTHVGRDGDGLVTAARSVGFRETRFNRDDGTAFSVLAIPFAHLHPEPKRKPGLQLV